MSVNEISISIAVILLYVFFHGDPDVVDAIRAKALIWADLK